MPDNFDADWIVDHLKDFSGYVGFYLTDEVIFTKMTFRLLGNILSETGGLFTVLTGIFFLLSYYFIYDEWKSAALKSTID